ncbi:DNA polymerase zeta catalytic subunit [Acrodontium crateriforme]|uniref:DNA polymerase n=1 Tax=Acrodontium crateriforme TaxID=150365 RepID=A0AAQ3LZS5_9PEZI|nr:DNA polymerase zeta catalytic subunit [Acrodontium crateriforme]
MAKQPDVFRVRLNCVDHYQHAPSTLDPPLWGSTVTSTQRGRLPQIPVIRVFGSTETGQKVCAHIHGALPYLFIPYTESLDKETVSSYINALYHSIDHALALSYRRNPYDNPRSSSFVAHISIVKGVPFFGYHVGYKYYLKIYLLNPTHMTRFADLLQQGAILKRPFQPYEAHLQYLLQWMCDFNLYGCAYIETTKPHFRLPIPVWEELGDLTHLWHDRSIAKERLLNEEKFPRQSHCQIELDIRIEDIMNRHEVQPRELHHSFIERLSSLENLAPEEKLVHSMAGLWKDETRRRKLRMGLKDPTSSPFPPEVLVSMSADPRNDSDGGWIHENEFREMVAELVEQERHARGNTNLSFDSFGSKMASNDDIPTIIASVEELFQDHLAMKHRARSREDNLGTNFETNVHVSPVLNNDDEPLIDCNEFEPSDCGNNYESDEEAAKEKALTQKVDNVRANQANESDTLHENQQKGGIFDAPTNASGNFKRPSPSANEHYVKRTKADERTSDGHSRRVSFRMGQVVDRPPGITKLENFSVHGDQIPPSSQKRAHMPLEVQTLPGASISLSQRSSQSSQNKVLDFPIVKTPKELRFRASQNELKDQRTAVQTEVRELNPHNASFTTSTKSSTVQDSNSTNWTFERPVISSSLTTAYTATFRASVGPTCIFAHIPPTIGEVESTLFPSVIYQDAYYSNEKDVPERPRQYAGQEFRLESTTLPYLTAFNTSGGVTPKMNGLDKVGDLLKHQRRQNQCSITAWEIMAVPPTWNEVQTWIENDQPSKGGELEHLDVDGPPTSSQLKRKNKPAPELSQIDGPTQRNKHGYKFSQRKASTSVKHETGYMSTMSLEVHVNTRDELAPDPEKDEVTMVVWCLSDEQSDDDMRLGIVVVNNDEDEQSEKIRRIVGNEVKVDAEDDELDLINRMVDIVRECDPDILTGYEVHNGSWGYLIERARLQYEFNLPDEFSRMKSQSHGRFGKDADRWGFTHTSTVRITGRHTINVWRAMRSELNLLQYTMENVVFHLLHRRIPHYSFATLTRWYKSGKARYLSKVVEYITTRTQLDIEILNANELIARTSEQARLLGVDFFSVFSRGSQFKVESLMFRIAKPESFVLVSPSRKQVGAQNALECLPLVMEPQSAFYNSPLLVLDFQSLYPSVMIAYNYCYSTCLGRIADWRGTNKMGFADFQRAPGLLELVKDKLNIAPNGMMYVKPQMRKSLLAKMLGEILETRVMVKSGMKVDKGDKTLQQLLNNRQLALKLIANVTYGYTSASFSGRMPCAEIADSIVQTGRETLEKAISFIHSVERWGAEVVYGDTDSLFVYVKGRTRDDAFKIGDEIAKAVTDMNPRPVKLKFEKVYHPCVLLAKKRYVGFKYEHPDHTEPEFDAKGIETVRRDGTPAEQKIEEKALKLLFRTSDLSEVKRYFVAQCSKILTGRVSVQDFCFAKEVKLGTYADKGPPPPGALIATKRMLRDPRMEPQYGERIPYVVIAGAPGARLWERCVEPERLVYDSQAELDAEYYINKNLIPPLERIFNLVGANVRQWYDEMPKVQRARMLVGPRGGDNNSKAKKTMESYMGSSLCLVCRTKLPPLPAHAEVDPLPLCKICRDERPQETILSLRRKLQKAERKAADMQTVCRDCANLAPDETVRCDSRDCPVFYSRVKAATQLNDAKAGIGQVLEAFMEETSNEKSFDW